jgi:hypothetical protein
MLIGLQFWRRKSIRDGTSQANSGVATVPVTKLCNNIWLPSEESIEQTNKLRGLSPRANYTDRATAAYRRNECQLLRIEVCQVFSTADPLQLYSRLSRPQPLIFLPVAPQLYSRGWVDPVPDPLLLRKFGSTGNRTRTSGSVARNFGH